MEKANSMEYGMRIGRQVLLPLIKDLPLREKEILFWDTLKLIGNEKLLFDSFTKEEIDDRFGVKLTNEEYIFLTENMDNYGWMMNEYVQNIIDDLLHEFSKKINNNDTK